MPTGYTYPVVEGKVTEFPDFAMQCARAFGALISMRDDAMDAPIPDEIKPSTNYYDQRIATAEAHLAELTTMTAAEAEAAAQAAHQNAMDGRERYLANQKTEADRLNAMLAKVRAWRPPTADHVEMKKFMIDQLTMSLPGDYAPAIPELLDGATWLERETKGAADDLARLKIDRSKEIQRASDRNQWLQNLRKSLVSAAAETG